VNGIFCEFPNLLFEYYERNLQYWASGMEGVDNRLFFEGIGFTQLLRSFGGREDVYFFIIQYFLKCRIWE